jgi:hypothetical protein
MSQAQLHEYTKIDPWFLAQLGERDRVSLTLPRRGAQAFEDGMSQAQLHEYTKIDPWFLAQLGELHLG